MSIQLFGNQVNYMCGVTALLLLYLCISPRVNNNKK